MAVLSIEVLWSTGQIPKSSTYDASPPGISCLRHSRGMVGKTWHGDVIFFPSLVLFLLTVAVDGTLRVDWSAASSMSDLALLGNTRTCLARRLILAAPLGTLDYSEVLIHFSHIDPFFFCSANFHNVAPLTPCSVSPLVPPSRLRTAHAGGP